MTSDEWAERLWALMSGADEHLRAFLAGGGLSTLRAARPQRHWPRDLAASLVRSVKGSTDAGAGARGLGDEQQLRALAKEIKRLIAEDQRRGLRLDR